MLSALQNGGLLCIGGDTKLGRLSIAARNREVTAISQDTEIMLALYPRESEIIQKEKSYVHMKQYGYNLILSLQFG